MKFTIDPDWRFTSMSEKAAAWCGSSAGDLVGRNSREVWPPPRRAVAKAVEAALATGATAILEQPSQFAPGRWVRLEIGPRAEGVGFCIEEITPRAPGEPVLRPAEKGGVSSRGAGAVERTWPAEVNPEDGSIAGVVTRLSSQYVLRGLRLLVAAFGDFRVGLVAQTIITANTAHLDVRGGEGWRYAAIDETPPDKVRRPISIGRIADASGLPFETTRRIAQRLTDAGVCMRGKGGLIVPAASLEQPEVVAGAVTNIGYVRRFVRDLQAVGLFESPSDWTHASNDPVEDASITGVVSRLSAEYGLRVLRLLIDSYGDILDGIIAQTIITANTAHLDERGGEGWRYAAIDETPPDKVRRPISITRLAESLGLPFETARRHVRRLVEAGACRRVQGGLIVPQAFLDRPQAAPASLANVRYVRKFVRSLLGAGLEAQARSGQAASPDLIK